MRQHPIVHLPNERRRRATESEQILAGLEAWQNEEKYKARRRQAARAQGGDRRVPALRSAARPRRTPSAADPMPRLFLSSLMLLGIGFFCTAYVLLRPLVQAVLGRAH